jgi:hypothetical protein
MNITNIPKINCPLNGYAINHERSQNIKRKFFTEEEWEKFDRLVSAPVGWEIKDILKTENQGNIGSCQGQSLTSVMEYCYYVATSRKLQLSRWYAYRESQIIDGIRGDRGSTIAGGVQLARTKGVCTEDLCPYPSRYTSQINPLGTASAAELERDASNYIIEGVVGINNINNASTFINAGLGGLHIGCAWNDNSFDGTVVERYSPRGASGGHAWCIVGRGNLEDDLGTSFIMLNSWGKNWVNSDNGFKELMPLALQDLINDNQTVVVGLSDMKTSDMIPRKMDWVNDGIADNLFN